MAQEQILDIASPHEEEQGPGPGTPSLAPTDKKRLDDIIIKMKANKEPDKNIQYIVNSFTSKYAKKQADESPTPSTPTQAEQNPLVALQKAAGAAQAKLDAESNGNDDAVLHLVRQGRQAKAAGNIPYSKTDASRVQLPNMPAPTPEAPISPDEIAATRESVNTNPISRRAHLKAVTQLHPEKSADLQEAQYLIDRQEELANDPNAIDRVGKVMENAKKIKKGDLQYSIGNGGQVRKPEGFIDSVISGLKSKDKLFEDYKMFKDASDPEIINKLESDRTNFDPEEPTPTPRGVAGSFGSMLGTTPIKSMVAGLLTTAADAPEAAPYISAAVGASDYYQMSYASTLRNSYNEFRGQGLSPEESLHKAKIEGVKEGLTDAASGIIMSAAGARNPLRGAPNLSAGFKNAAMNIVKKSAHYVGEQGFEGAAVGLTQGIAQYAKNKEAQAAGLNREDFQDVGEQAMQGALFTIGLAAMTKLGGAISGKAYKQILQGVSKATPEEIDAKLGEMIASKQITPAEADAAKTAIEAHKAIDSTIPENVTEESRMKIQDKIQRRSELEKELETKDAAYHPEIKEKIKAINEDILELSKDKIKRNAIQEQERRADAIRDTPADGATVGHGDEKEKAVDQISPGEGGEAVGPQKPTRVLEARHSTTEHDEQEIMSGQNQLGLSDDGVTAAHDLKEEVQANHSIDKIVTSALKRSKETGEIVADGKIPVESRPELNSWDTKDFGGITDAEWKKVLPWFAEHPNETKYNGPLEEHKGKALGESLNDYAHRAIEARQKVEVEGPGTMVISHSNNMNIWEAYKDNGDKWDKAAIDDYISRANPEPATIVNSPEEDAAGHQIIEAIKIGKISDEELARGVKLFIEHETGTEIPAEGVHEGNGAEAGDNETADAPRQYSKISGPQQVVPTPGQGPGTAGGNQTGQPVSGAGSAPDAARLTKASKQLITAGRTDDQILTYLERKGLDAQTALAVLGEAKANPLDEQAKAVSMKEVTALYFGKEGDWLGDKELTKVNSQQLARDYQTAIKKSVADDPKQKGIRPNDIDEAIHIYLDTQRNPSHLGEYYAKQSPEQKRIADISQNLNPRQLEIAEAIKQNYVELGKFTKDEGLIKDVIDDYVARAWDIGSKPATEEQFKFKTSTRHQLERTLDTILQGQAEGMTLKIKGATNNLQILQQEISNVVENRRHLDEGLSLKIDTGEKDAKGNPVMTTLFSTTQQPGYAKIESPTFRKWEYAGKIADHPEQDAQTFGRRRDVLVTEDGTVMKKSDVYAPEEVAKSLNNILGKGKLSSVQGLINFNAAVKQSILSYSGFHFIAFSRAHILSAKFDTPKAVSLRASYKAGLSMLADKHPIGQELIRNGMTLNRQQDFMEGVTEHNTWVGKQLDKLSATKAIKDKLIDINTQFHKYLFNTYGAGLKMFDGVNLAKSELAKNANADPKEVYARVAKLMNDTYGGINWQRMHGTRMQDPTFRQISSMMLLAPDWTSSNLRFAKKAIGRGDEGTLYRKAWGRVILRGVSLTAAANAIMAVWDDKDDDGNQLTWMEAMERRASKAWDIGHLRSTMIDITPLYHAIGGDSGKRAYFSIFGAYTDPMKMVSNPVDFLESKGSFTTKAALETFTAQNWQHKEFTTLDELLGMDDKGQYAKSQTAHQKGDISPTTGLPYKKDQSGHDEGDEKGGKLGGQLTKYPEGGAHGVTYPQLPSFIGSQVRGMMPTAVQNFWQIAAGENDMTTGILNAVGTGILTDKEPKKKDE